MNFPSAQSDTLIGSTNTSATERGHGNSTSKIGDYGPTPRRIEFAGVEDNNPKGVTMSLVVAQSLSKTYATDSVQVKALQEVSFNIAAGSFLAFVGPSGSGKTTLLNLIGCLDKPTHGNLEVAGVDIVQLGRQQAAQFRGQNIGFIFQSFNLLPVLSAFENVEYPLVMVQERPLVERRSRVLKLLKAVGMLEQKDQRPEQLSGGQKQRVAIARALVTQPKYREPGS